MSSQGEGSLQATIFFFITKKNECEAPKCIKPQHTSEVSVCLIIETFFVRLRAGRVGLNVGRLKSKAYLLVPRRSRSKKHGLEIGPGR